MNSQELDEDFAPEIEARRKATALNNALRERSRAIAYRLNGEWYVVTSGTGEGFDFAYKVVEVDIDEVRAHVWDYSLWCTLHTPTSDRLAAAAYYLYTGLLLGEYGCSCILTKADIELLDMTDREVAT